MEKIMTVAGYLKLRLEQLGIQQMFGVAGNYTAAFMDTILSDPESNITISGNANELCAGFAADGYARSKGPCAIYVTYSVGAFSLVNTIAGSYTEQVPVLLVNGAPTNKECAVERNTGLLYSHTTGYQQVDIHMFRPITAAAERITDARRAPFQIDSALMAMLASHRPVYLEIAEDLWHTPCDAPRDELQLRLAGPVSTTVSNVNDAANAVVELIRTRPKTLFWAGVELQRLDLQQEFSAMLEQVNRSLPQERQIRFVTSALSKSVISEENQYFEGCYTLSKAEIDDLVGDDGCIVGIGAWTIGKDTGNENIRGDQIALAAQGGVFVGANYYPSVDLSEFILSLGQALGGATGTEPERFSGLRLPKPEVMALQAESTAELGYDRLYQTLQPWLTDDDILVVDAGFPLIAAQPVKVTSAGGFVAQAAWLSIGYSVPAATGIKCANPDKRVIVTVGDGAFHENCQALSDHYAYGHNTVVFVIANDLFGVEQYIVNPNPFRNPLTEYPQQGGLLNSPYPYNKLPAWNFDKFAEAFGGIGRTVSTEEELMNALIEIREKPDDRFLVAVQVPETDLPEALRKKVDGAVGEDETANANWPPREVF